MVAPLRCRLMRLAMALTVVALPRMATPRTLRAAWHADTLALLDHNGDGTLTLAEAAEGYMTRGQLEGPSISKSNIRSLFWRNIWI